MVNMRYIGKKNTDAIYIRIKTCNIYCKKNSPFVKLYGERIAGVKCKSTLEIAVRAPCCALLLRLLTSCDIALYLTGWVTVRRQANNFRSIKMVSIQREPETSQEIFHPLGGCEKPKLQKSNGRNGSNDNSHTATAVPLFVLINLTFPCRRESFRSCVI